MILRLVLGLKEACVGFDTTGVSTASRMQSISEPGDSFCEGVAGMGVVSGPCASVFVDVVLERGACTSLTSEEGLGDSGLDGCISITNNDCGTTK